MSTTSELMALIGGCRGNVTKVEEFLNNVPRREKYPLIKAGLMEACKCGHVEVVKMFLDLGADIHYNFDGPLRMAAMHGHTKLVKYLLFDRPSHLGRAIATSAALAEACNHIAYYGSLYKIAIVKMLLDAGAMITNHVLDCAASLPSLLAFLLFSPKLPKETKSNLFQTVSNEDDEAMLWFKGQVEMAVRCWHGVAKIKRAIMINRRQQLAIAMAFAAPDKYSPELVRIIAQQGFAS